MDASERLTVDEAMGATLLGASHVHRYEVAAALCAGLRVADVCCGVGYGSAILRDACPDVVGVDVAETAIAEARRVFGDRDGLRFELGDAVEFLAAASPAALDAIVMLEGLEHVARVDEAIAQLRRLAGAGVRLVVSVPNVRANVGDNPFHLTDFDLEDVRALVAELPGGALLEQHIAEGSLIRARPGADVDCRLVAEEHAEPEYAYAYLVCANVPDPLDQPATARATLALEPLHHRYINGLERANEALAQANRRLARERVGVAESASASVLARLDAANDEIARLKAELAPPGVDPEETAEQRANREQREWTDSLIAEIDRHRGIVEELSRELEQLRAEREAVPRSLPRRVARRLRG